MPKQHPLWPGVVPRGLGTHASAANAAGNSQPSPMKAAPGTNTKSSSSNQQQQGQLTRVFPPSPSSKAPPRPISAGRTHPSGSSSNLAAKDHGSSSSSPASGRGAAALVPTAAPTGILRSSSIGRQHANSSNDTSSAPRFTKAPRAPNPQSFANALTTSSATPANIGPTSDPQQQPGSPSKHTNPSNPSPSVSKPGPSHSSSSSQPATTLAMVNGRPQHVIAPQGSSASVKTILGGSQGKPTARAGGGGGSGGMFRTLGAARCAVPDRAGAPSRVLPASFLTDLLYLQQPGLAGAVGATAPGALDATAAAATQLQQQLLPPKPLHLNTRPDAHHHPQTEAALEDALRLFQELSGTLHSPTKSPTKQQHTSPHPTAPGPGQQGGAVSLHEAKTSPWVLDTGGQQEEAGGSTGFDIRGYNPSPSPPPPPSPGHGGGGRDGHAHAHGKGQCMHPTCTTTRSPLPGACMPGVQGQPQQQQGRLISVPLHTSLQPHHHHHRHSYDAALDSDQNQDPGQESDLRPEGSLTMQLSAPASASGSTSGGRLIRGSTAGSGSCPESRSSSGSGSGGLGLQEGIRGIGRAPGSGSETANSSAAAASGGGSSSYISSYYQLRPAGAVGSSRVPQSIPEERSQAFGMDLGPGSSGFRSGSGSEGDDGDAGDESDDADNDGEGGETGSRSGHGSWVGKLVPEPTLGLMTEWPPHVASEPVAGSGPGRPPRQPHPYPHPTQHHSASTGTCSIGTGSALLAAALAAGSSRPGTAASQAGPGRPGSRVGSRLGSRPGTASSYWSNYDVDEQALAGYEADLARPPPSPSGSSKAGKKPVPISPRKGLLARSSSRKGPARFPNSTSLRQRSGGPHPSVVMDPHLLHLTPGASGSVPLDEKGRPYPYILPPGLPGAYPTISFAGTASEKQAEGLQPLEHLRLLVKYAGIANSPVKAAFKEAGFRPTKGKRWHVIWGSILDAAAFAKLHEFQRVNHFPGTWELGRKDYLYRNVYNMRRARGEAFDLIPRFFLMPRDYEEFRQDLERFPGRMYIQKPVNSSRGRGIRMVTRPQEVTREGCKDGVLIQHYIHNPYLINGFKFDMRIYVAATCVDPLRVYVYEDGLARFATEAYTADKADLKKRCMHLTNYSVNKKSSKFVAATSAGDEGEAVEAQGGSKWSLRALRAHIEREGRADWSYVWGQVHDIVAKALLSVESRLNTENKMKVPHRNTCFEVWGFDIMLDDNFRAWLIEVNTCPALAADSPLDKRVKFAMIADVMHLIGPVPYDPDVYEEVEEARRQARLTGLGQRADAGSGASYSAQVKARTLKEAEDMDFRGMPPEDLPDIIVEAEAEYARRRGWERVFPCVAEPARYLDLFETPRAHNIILCKYYAQRMGLDWARASVGSRPGTMGRRGMGSAPAAEREYREWRPGGTGGI